MSGPIGPPGFNGSQGPAGPAGSIGAPGPKGAGDFSACQYKTVTETQTPGDSSVSAVLAEPNVNMLFSSLSPGLFDSCWDLRSLKVESNNAFSSNH